MSTDIKSGAWSARWGDWVVGLRERAQAWQATVWRWTRGGGLDERRQLGVQDGFASPPDAVAWACDVLRDSGVTVMVLGMPALSLEKLLEFTPAPEGVT